MTPETSNNNPGLAPLISGIVNDAQTLLRQQLNLFQTEIKNDLSRSKDAATSLAVGGVVALLAGFLLCLMLAHLLVYIWPNLPLFAAYGIVGLLLGAVGGAFIYMGKHKFDEFNPLPDKSVQGIKETVQWNTKT